MKQFFFPKTISSSLSLISSSKPCSTFIMNRGRSRGWSPSSSSNHDSPNLPIQDQFPQIGRPQESRSSQWDVEIKRSKNPHEMKVVDYSSDPRRPYQNASRGKGMTSRAKSPDRVIQQKGRTSVKVSPKRKMSPKREDGQHSPEHTDTNTIPPFHICVKQHGTVVIKSSLLVINKEKRREIERSINDPRKTILRPGMVLLKNYISHDDQIKIIKTCEQLGGEDGFYQPGYNDGAKLRLHMMCLGKDWDPEQRSYGDIRSDGFKPPIIPAELKEIVSDAILASHAKMRDSGEKNPHEAVPCMEPDICIVNFYTNSGKLGLHQDRDESAESIDKGLPVVSFSIGDSAEFLYGDDRDPEQAKKVELKSGDVVIFGGKSRLIFHGVPSIIPGSAPKVLAEKANLRPGRLNLTFRKF